MMAWIRKYGLVVLLLLPAWLRAQEVNPVPVDTGIVGKTINIAREMLRVIREEPDCFNQLKGGFFLTDEYGNNYYKARNVDLYTEKAYVDEKPGGQVSFVANWKQVERGDHAASMASVAFVNYLTKQPAGKMYELETPVKDQSTANVTYYLKETGPKGRRVAYFIFNTAYKESTFVVDGR